MQTSALAAVLLGWSMAQAFAQPNAARFLRFEDVREVVDGFASAGIVTGGLPDRAGWDEWIRDRDRETRARVDRGVEDSISNLILYGTSFTPLPRMESTDEAVNEAGALTEAARVRVHALASALAHSEAGERLRFVHDFLERRGIAQGSVESVLGANLRRFASEQRAYQEKLQAAGKSGDTGQLLFTRSTLYQDRGLSVDTSLLPNYALEDTLRVMMQKGALAAGSIRRIAVIGPGLDFTDKRDGYDYYPLQTIQPFAIIEAAIRLGLAPAGKLDLEAFDLNPLVIAHVRRQSERARAGRPYVLQLPRDTLARWRPEAVSYWQHFGDVVGRAVEPLRLPAGLADVVARSVAVQPQYAARVTSLDLDVIAQTLDTTPGEGFDLVVATNVLVYYDLFQQALAMASIARLMNPGGLLLVNHTLPAQHPSALAYVGRRSVTYSANRAYGDDVVVYRRR